MEAIIIAELIILILNFLMLAALSKRTDRMEAMIAAQERTRQSRLERNTLQALTLLREGKTEEARQIAARIINA